MSSTFVVPAVVFAVLFGFSSRVKMLRRSPSTYFRWTVYRILLNLGIAWTYLYFALPARVGPYRGYGLLIALMLFGNGVVSRNDYISNGSDEDDGPGCYIWQEKWVTYLAILSFVLWCLGGEPSTEKNALQVPLEPYRSPLSASSVLEEIDSGEVGADRETWFAFKQGKSYAATLLLEGGKVIVTPLEYKGFAQWRSARNEVDWGWLVSVEVGAESRSTFVRAGRNAYTPGAFMERDLHRHIYDNGYANAYQRGTTFRLKSPQEGYWVIVLTRPSWMWAGEKPVAVLVVHPVTGEITEYAVSEAPEWTGW